MNLLVVDDELSVANYCCKVLSQSGHSTMVANSGSDALAILDQTEIDLILSDVRMPGMSGLELLERLAHRDSRPVVVLMTGYGTIAAAVEAMRLGAYDYILKPVSPEELVAIVHRVEEARALRQENRLLRFRLAAQQGVGGMVGSAPSMLPIFASILRIADKRHPVLITGETGTGKELVARAIHNSGRTPNAPFVAVDCGALPASLVESELFGHVRGAFTGAALGRPGLLASAGSGTLFLDEIGELPTEIQARLFRVLQEREFRPLGSDSSRKFDARVIAATDQNLEEAMKKGTFRQELYFRLNVYAIGVPPLRNRREDLPMLVEHFLRKHAEGRTVVFGADAMAALTNYDWPGNVRELENCILRMLAESEGPTFGRGDLPAVIRAAVTTPQDAASPLEKAERAAIVSAIDATQGNVAEAARKLGVSKATLYRKLSRYSIGPDRSGEQSHDDAAGQGLLEL